MRLAPAVPRALVVPDPALWAAGGVDVMKLGVEPVSAPDRADLILLSARLPRGLEEAVRDARARLPDPSATRVVEGLAVAGPPAEEALAAARDSGADDEPEPGDDQRHGDHQGHHDHDEMMAVTGEPSSDGLVMEDAEAVMGPLGPALPTGLVWRAALDGDVVCDSRIESLLRAPEGEGAAADPLAPAAARWAAERARAAPLRASLVPLRVVAVELERALSHVQWLARFWHTLGVAGLADSLRTACGPLIGAHADLLRRPDQPPEPPPLASVREVLNRVESGWIRTRLEGIGAVDPDECREHGIGGPIARASGLEVDARRDDPAYGELGFAPVRREVGDAAARTQLRVEEALVSLELAERALAADELPVGEGGVEGPRGPVAVTSAGPSGAAAIVAPGAGAAVELAAASACGYELSRAVVAIASFDLSPGMVGS